MLFVDINWKIYSFGGAVDVRYKRISSRRHIGGGGENGIGG